MNICKNCKHFRTQREGRIWYDHFCAAPAVARPKIVCPQTGETGYEGVNALGNKYLDHRPEPYARQINPDGNCQHYSLVYLKEVSA